MTKKPNAMGRIEADPKPKKNFKPVLYTIGAIALVVLGVVTTLRYQSFIEDTKQQGIAEYREDECQYFETTNKEKVLVKWYECKAE